MSFEEKENEITERTASAPKNEGSSFAVVEAYKKIRMNLMYPLSQTNIRSFVITSTFQSEGKSTTSINVAIAFSQLGQRVLLIDGDMRMPTVHKKIKVPNKDGLSTVIAGFVPFEEAVIKSVRPNFDVLTAGPIPPNPSELMGSEGMQKLLDYINDKYDAVVIDTPPVGIVSDALVLAGKTAGIVLVTRCKDTTYDQVEDTIEAIKLSNVKLLGVIINGGKHKGSRYYKY